MLYRILHYFILPYTAQYFTALHSTASYLLSPCRQAALRSAPRGVSLSFSSSLMKRDSCCQRVTLTLAQDHFELYGISMGNPLSSTHRVGPCPGVEPEGASRIRVGAEVSGSK